MRNPSFATLLNDFAKEFWDINMLLISLGDKSVAVVLNVITQVIQFKSSDVIYGTKQSNWRTMKFPWTLEKSLSRSRHFQYQVFYCTMHIYRRKKTITM